MVGPRIRGSRQDARWVGDGPAESLPNERHGGTEVG
jgi:hypothetical protein